MTTFTIHPAMNSWELEDFLAMDFDKVTSPSISSSRISGYVDGVFVSFEGYFTYTAYGLTGGTVNSITFSDKGIPLLSYTDMKLGVLNLAYGIGVESAMFGGDDTVISHWNAGSSFATGAGDDRLTLGPGDDTVEGGSGTDTLVLGTPYQPAQITLSGSSIVVDSAKGRDTLTNVEILEFSGKTVSIRAGTPWSETMTGDRSPGALSDILFGGGGNDRISGGIDNDRLFGNDGDDRISGGRGRDLLDGGTGGDSLSGDKGIDRLLGRAGQDQINGGGNDDVLLGHGGDDLLWGSSGDDRLNGGAGRDRLAGQTGDDVLTGGAGRDTFTFSKGQGNDRITAFEIGRDVIAIGKGANSLSDLGFTRKGGDVLVSFADVTILVEGVKVADLRDPGNFDF